MHSKCWAAAPGKEAILIGVLSDKLSGHLPALNRKQCRLVMGLLTGYRTVRWLLHIMGLMESAKCKKYVQEEESSYHILRKAQRRLGIDSGYIWLYIARASAYMVLSVYKESRG
jgi:hypothetical protein